MLNTSVWNMNTFSMRHAMNLSFRLTVSVWQCSSGIFLTHAKKMKRRHMKIDWWTDWEKSLLNWQSDPVSVSCEVDWVICSAVKEKKMSSGVVLSINLIIINGLFSGLLWKQYSHGQYRVARNFSCRVASSSRIWSELNKSKGSQLQLFSKKALLRVIYLLPLKVGHERTVVNLYISFLSLILIKPGSSNG